MTADEFQALKVDVVALSPDGKLVDLHIVHEGTWTGSPNQLKSLQDKIHNYVGFALDGQMHKLYPNTVGLPWRIVIDCLTGLPDQSTTAVIERIAEAVRRYGGDLTLKCKSQK